MRYTESTGPRRFPARATVTARDTPTQLKRKRLSANPADGGRGWFVDPDDPHALYILGERIQLRTDVGYSTSFLAERFVALKNELRDRNYEFKDHEPLVLHLNVLHASTILTDGEMLLSLKRILRYARSKFTPKPGEPPLMRILRRAWHLISVSGRFEIVGLASEITLDGDKIPLIVTRAFPKPGYEFYVPRHPDRPNVGMYCRPSE